MVPTTSFPLNGDGRSRQSQSVVEEMECDELNPSNNPRIDKEEDIRILILILIPSRK